MQKNKQNIMYLMVRIAELSHEDNKTFQQATQKINY